MKKLFRAALAVLLLTGHGSAQEDITARVVEFPVINPPQQVSSASLQTVGNPGPAIYYYWIVTNTLLGSSAPAGPLSARNAPNTLSGSNFIRVTWAPVPGAISYDVLRTSSSYPPAGACNCAVATAAATPSVDDTGSLNAYTVAAVDARALRITLANEPTAAGVTHLIMRQNGVQVADLNLVGGSGYTSILDEGTGQTQRSNLNFTGAGVSCVDNPGAARTDCTISQGLVSPLTTRGDLLTRDGSTHIRLALGLAKQIPTSDGTDLVYRFPELRSHATDCTSLTDGREGQACYEQDVDTLYVCEPTAGLCDSAAEWRLVSSAGGAPTGATYVTQTPDGTLSAEQALSALSNGLMRVANGTGAVTSINTSAGIFDNISDESGATGVMIRCALTSLTIGDFCAWDGTNWVNAAPGVPFNAQTGTSYTIVTGDRGKLLTFNNAGATAVTLPQAGSAGFAANFYFEVFNIGAGAVTITPTTSTIDGNANKAIAQNECALVRSDNTNYRTLNILRCDGSDAPGGSGDSVNVDGVAATDPDFVTGAGDIDWVLDTGATPDNIIGQIVAGAVGNSELRDSAALSVIGRSANSTGDPADIAAGSDGDVLRRSGTTLGFGQVATAGIADGAVDSAKVADNSITDDDVASELDTITKSITVFDPVTGDTNRAQVYFPTAVTITRVVCSVAAATSVTIQLDERAEATPNTAGTDVMTSTLVCDTDSQPTTSFTNATIAARVPLNLQITAVSGTPGTLRVHIEATID